MTATDQCMQLYQQPLIDCMPLVSPLDEFFDATVMTTMSSEGVLSPSNSYNTSAHKLTPNINALKPIRRRSRGSKRTPITLLKANTSNFRALVQQFTGCPNTKATSFAIHKGPITLNFQQGSKHHVQHHTTRAFVTPFDTTCFKQVHQVDVPLPWQNQPKPQPLMQEQLCGNWLELDHVKSSNFLPTSGNSCMEVSHGLLFDDNFSLQELTVNAFSSDEGGVFM
ncbi:uncharacterized protein LOC113859980 [Abrus precatorius]|uniref:Uncharacterized protein LOC113859980 n=1 Tax=Abrus precatorius TaxID=3816 RepID=A0A8B8KWY5_ABRPR|nr:uncharacterized protein LOC113859980 [Abrus precatorius]